MKAWDCIWIYAAVFRIVTARALSFSCRHVVSCPCGLQRKNIKLCVDEVPAGNFCSRWERCNNCRDGLSDCDPGLEGSKRPRSSYFENASREKRQTRGRTNSRRPPGRPRSAAQTGSENPCQHPGAILDGTFSVQLPGSSPRARDNPSEDEYPPDTRLRYRCDRDQVLIGSAVLTCRSTGSWSSSPPFCTTECGRPFVEGSLGKINRRVLHGTQTEDGEWPWVVAIGIRRSNHLQIECGGSLLNSQTVVTAAHCLVADSFTLYFGKIHRSIAKDDTEVMVRQSTRWVRHPSYNSSTLDSDIGLIFFAPRVRYSDRIQPVCLPSQETTARNLMTGKSGYVTGWGLTEKQLAAEELRMAQLPVLSNQECIESYRNMGTHLPMTPRMFCAGFRNAQQAVCSGDSGSPLVFQDSGDDRFTMEGLVSFGVQGQCGQPGRYTLFTKVIPFVPWILRQMS